MESKKTTMEILKEDNQTLIKHVSSLYRKIGGYKRANSYYKELNENLKKEISIIKDYAKEGDELNENKAETILELRKETEGKDKIINGLQDQVLELRRQLCESKTKINELTTERDIAIGDYNNMCKIPWYKRFFM